MRGDMLIVIRTNGERTMEVCRDAALLQTDAGMVRVIAEKPFFAAVRRTFALGADSDAPFLLALDADVLLLPGALDYMAAEARRYMDGSVFRIDFPLLDKFRGRTIGAHCYDNRLSFAILERLKSVPEASAMFRPESDNVVAFCKERGLDFHLVKPEHAVACHDFLQYFSQLQYKYVTRHARCLVDGNLAALMGALRTKCDSGTADNDERLVLAVLEHCAENGGHCPDMMKLLGLSEKAALSGPDCKRILTALPCVGQELSDAFSKIDNSLENLRDFGK